MGSRTENKNVTKDVGGGGATRWNWSMMAASGTGTILNVLELIILLPFTLDNILTLRDT